MSNDSSDTYNDSAADNSPNTQKLNKARLAGMTSLCLGMFALSPHFLAMIPICLAFWFVYKLYKEGINAIILPFVATVELLLIFSFIKFGYYITASFVLLAIIYGIVSIWQTTMSKKAPRIDATLGIVLSFVGLQIGAAGHLIGRSIGF